MLQLADLATLANTRAQNARTDLKAYPRRRRPSRSCPLSSREIEILGQLAEGKVYKQIAYDLSLSTSTVRTHLHHIYVKLGTVDRAQAVLLATRSGWL